MGRLVGDGEVLPFHATVEELEEGSGALSGLPDLEGAAGAILLADPFSFPTDAVLRFLSDATPLLPLLGGAASARTPTTARCCSSATRWSTAAPSACASTASRCCRACPGRGADRPRADHHGGRRPHHRRAGRQARARKLREAIDGLSQEDRDLVDGGLLMGIVVDNNKPDYLQGDFLVRGLVGADPETGEVAVGTEVRPGQVVRLHARDASSADRDLHRALGIRMEALGGRRPAGALVFACNGRGSGMFGSPDHDAEAIADELAGAPAAGFFAAGEIGPVGGEYFLHSFTATVAVFAR